MNKMTIQKTIITLIFLVCASITVLAGNKDRTGQSGAGELLINPWARSSGLFGLNGANVKGLEAMKVNIAGLSGLVGTEIGVAHTRYLAGTGMSVSNAGVALQMGEKGVVGVNIMTFGFGEIPVTTVNSPEGGLGTYKPSFFNASLGFARKFSQSMSAGINVTFVNETVQNINASALGLDAGIQYATGEKDNFKIGITIRNVGTNLRFSGDGFSFDGNSPEGSKAITVQQRSDKYQLPSQLNIATSYDFYLDKNEKELDENGSPKDAVYNPKHRLTPSVSFISNSFTKDWIGVAAEYAYKEQFMARLAYRYEADIFSNTETTTFYTGLAAGVGFQTELGEGSGTKIAIDYAFRSTIISNGVHSLGLRFYLGQDSEK
jgi:hypothetical protein